MGKEKSTDVELQKEQHKGAGHRKRLREKFLRSGLEAFLDYEIVELLLTLGSPRKDCKEQSKEAIKRFKGLRGVLDASLEELQEIKGIGPHNIFGLKLFREVSTELFKEKLLKKEMKMLKSSKEVYEYLYASMRHLKKEVFKVIFLNGKNQVLEIKDLFEGSLTSSAIYPREVIRNSIKYNAVALVFAHNHLSGEAKPSESDKKITEDLIFAGKIMNIKVLDHIIIGENKYFSFANQGLIDEYNKKFNRRHKNG